MTDDTKKEALALRAFIERGQRTQAAVDHILEEHAGQPKPKLFTINQDIEQVRAAYRLAPCPFCGSSEVETLGRHRKTTWVVVCLNCHAFGPEIGPNDTITEAEAISLWNRRVTGRAVNACDEIQGR